MTTTETVRELCKRIVERVQGTNLGAGKRAADAALNMFAGAAYTAELTGNAELAKHLTTVAVMLVSIRGYSEVLRIAHGECADCGKQLPGPHGAPGVALARTRDNVLLCSQCGTAEALRDVVRP